MNNEKKIIGEEKRIKDKLDFFMSEKVFVHVQLKEKKYKNSEGVERNFKEFLNGYIEKETARPGVYWFIERKLGGVFLFLREVFEVEEYREMERRER